MAFNPMDFFQAGSQLGQANAGPANYAAGNMMDVFNKMQMLGIQTQMMANQERMKQGIMNQVDPVRMKAAADLQAETGGNFPGGTSSPSGVAMPGSIAGNTVSGSPSRPSGSQMDLKSVKMLNKTYEDPGFESKVDQHKKLLESNVNLNQLSGIMDNYVGNLKSAWLEQGGADPLHAAAGSALAWAKQPNTAYIRGIQNLKMEAQAAIARQMQGSSQGIQRMFAVTGHNIPDNWENPGAAGSMINDMLTNSYVMNEGVKRAGWTENQLLSASPEELKNALDTFKRSMPPEELQALREHLGQHFGNIVPSQTSSLTGEINTNETNPLIKRIIGENPNRKSILGQGSDNTSSSGEDEMVRQALAQRPQSKSAILAMYKQRTGRDYNG